MKEIGLPYSGQLRLRPDGDGLADQPHGLAEGDKAVRCDECHTRQGGRLAQLRGFYMPGRDRNRRGSTASGSASRRPDARRGVSCTEARGCSRAAATGRRR